mgnify:CR=1 FL=1
MKAYIFFALLFIGCLSTFGVDVASKVTSSQFQCMKDSHKINYAIVRAWRSFGGIDANANETLKNAKNAGLETDIYMFPCRGKLPGDQAQEMMDKTDSTLYDKVWIDV